MSEVKFLHVNAVEIRKENKVNVLNYTLSYLYARVNINIYVILPLWLEREEETGEVEGREGGIFYLTLKSRFGIKKKRPFRYKLLLIYNKNR